MPAFVTALRTELTRRYYKAEQHNFRSFGYDPDKCVDELYQQMRREVLGVINEWYDEMTQDRQEQRP